MWRSEQAGGPAGLPAFAARSHNRRQCGLTADVLVMSESRRAAVLSRIYTTIAMNSLIENKIDASVRHRFGD